VLGLISCVKFEFEDDFNGLDEQHESAGRPGFVETHVINSILLIDNIDYT
jgi:hypothetical protein